LPTSGRRYCLDTSGLSNPLEFMPEDIHPHLWSRISNEITNGTFAVTKEIYNELVHLSGQIGTCIQTNEASMVLEIGVGSWNWNHYLSIVSDLRSRYHSVISEYNGNRKGTVGLNDVSIVALAKALGYPVISMESISFQPSAAKIRIPGLCGLEGVVHHNFNAFLRNEGITI